MELSDIVKVAITDDMVEQAQKDRDNHSLHIKEKIPLKDDRDYTGSLAHQAVENTLDRYHLRYTSSRLVRIPGGDKYDIIYDSDLIDIKGNKGAFNKDYFWSKEFLVMQHQIDRGLFEDMDYLCFVLVDLEVCYIYGIISIEEFLKKAINKGPANTNGYLKYDNKAIKGWQLTPFTKYIFRDNR